MLHYLINLSFVWLTGILFFDLFLRKETFHAANRAYLLFLLFLGLVLPLIPFDSNMVSGTMVEKPVHNLLQLKETIPQQSIVTTENNFSVETIILYVYLIGVLVGLLWMMKEVITLFSIYKRGSKTAFETYTIIKTNATNSPFSLGKLIFISSEEQYTPQELEMILSHEIKHCTRLHLFDKLAITILRILFWFHPLVHLYYKRLMMVQEYEADNCYTKNQTRYGSFLLEQTLLHSHDFISHSFNYSPIKNRILMLTKNKSSQTKLFKYAVLLPLMTLFLVCCTKEMKSLHKHERKQNGNVISFKGNEFELSNKMIDSLYVEDPVTGEIALLKVTREPYPLKMNGKKIMGWGIDGIAEYNVAPMLKTDEGNISLFLYQELKESFAKLTDGEYELPFTYLIVDEKGNLVYYDEPELRNVNNDSKFVVNDKGHLQSTDKEQKSNKKEAIDSKLKDEIEDKVTNLLDSKMKFSPGQMNGKPVICLQQTVLKFSVKDHKAQFKS